MAGGVGASTLAWCLAEAASAWLLDFSHHQRGVLYAAGLPEARFASCVWPAVLEPGDAAAAALAQGARWYGVTLLSGGTAPPAAARSGLVRAAAESLGCAVLDGPSDGSRLSSLRCVVGTNQPRVWERLLETDAQLFVVRMTREGLTAPEVTEGLGRGRVWLLPDESAVRRGVDLGWGVPPTARLRKVCAEIARQHLTADG